jgi:hypothetical protein
MVNLIFLSISNYLYERPHTAHCICTNSSNKVAQDSCFHQNFSLKLYGFEKGEKLFWVARFNVSTSERKYTKHSTRHRFRNQPAVNTHVLCLKQRTVIEFLPAESSSVRDSHKRLKASEDMTLRTETQQVAV